MTMQNRDRLLKKLKAIQGKPRERMRAALEVNAREITDMQKRLVPVSSGDLRNSIGFTFGNYSPENSNVRGVAAGGGGDPDLSVTIHAGDAKAFYASFVEFGTKGPYEVGGKFAGAVRLGNAARPFFYPAYRALRKRAKSRLTRAMKRGIREAVGA